MSQLPTGNPVFDYRAGYRAFALNLQRVLLIGGGLSFLGCLVAYVGAETTPRLHSYLGYGAIAGAVLFTAGIQWGFHWRQKLRAQFRHQYGLR